MVFVLVAFVESCLRFYGADEGEVPSAAYAWVGNMDSMQIQSMRILFFYLVFLISALAFSDSLFIDLKTGASNLIATRCPARAYLASTAVLSFVGGFAVTFIPLCISQLLALTAFPVEASPNAFSSVLNNPAYDNYWAGEAARNALFPSLYFNHPYASNLLFILSASTWAGIASVGSFATSLFVRSRRLVVLGAPTLAYLLWLFAAPACYALPYYLYPTIFVPGLSTTLFFTAPPSVLIALVFVILFAVHRERDVLL